MLYRLFTENKNKDRIYTIVSKYYEGFSVFENIGYWLGKQENSLCIEIVAENEDNTIDRVCYAIKDANLQDCVLVQKIEIVHSFV